VIEQRFIAAINRIESALSRIEKSAIADNDLAERHEKLKSETHMAIKDLDKILADAR
jgi:ferritin-like metal-binding protein YciE